MEIKSLMRKVISNVSYSHSMNTIKVIVLFNESMHNIMMIINISYTIDIFDNNIQYLKDIFDNNGSFTK